MSEQAFDPYHKWLGIPPAEQPPTHYRLLGIASLEKDPDVIERAADQRMAYVRSLSTGKQSAVAQRILNELATAKLTLLNTAQKLAYDQKLTAQSSTQSRPTSKPLPTAKPLVAPGVKVAPGVATTPAVPLGPTIAVANSAVPARRHAKTTSWQLPAAIGGGVLGLLVIVGVAVLVLSGGSNKEVAKNVVPKQNPAPAEVPVKPTPPVDAPKTPPIDSPAVSEVPPQTPDPPTTPSVVETPTPPVIEPKPTLPPATTNDPGAVEAPPLEEKPTPADVAAKVESPSVEPMPPVAVEPRSAGAKLPVPSSDALQKTGVLIDEIYGVKFRAAKTEEEKATIARAMFKNSQETKDDPVAQYVLLERSKQVGILIGDGGIINDAVQEQAVHFDVDFLQGYGAALEAASNKALAREQHESLAERMLKVTQEAALEGRFEITALLQKSLEDYLQRVRQVELKAEIRDTLREVKVQQAQWQQAETALTQLKQDPGNAAAQLTYGRYLALVRDDWTKALPHLVKSGDKAIVEAAELDVAGAEGVDEQVRIGDVWHKASTANKQNDGFVERARFWYEKAKPNAASLVKAKIENRLAEIDAQQKVKGATGKERLKPKEFWLPVAAQGYLTQCFALGPFKPEEVTDAAVLTYIEKRKPDEKLAGKVLQPYGATAPSLYGKTVPTFIGPDEPPRYMYYVFRVKIDKEQTVVVRGDSFFEYGHNRLYITVDGRPVETRADVVLPRGTHTIIVKQDFIRTDRADRSYMRLQVEGENVLQKVTYGQKP